VGPKVGLEDSKGRKIFAPLLKSVLLDVLRTAFNIKAILDKQTFVFVNLSYVKRRLICGVRSLEHRSFGSLACEYTLFSNLDAANTHLKAGRPRLVQCLRRS